MIWGSAVEAWGAVGCEAWQREHPCSLASCQGSSQEHQTCLRVKFREPPWPVCHQVPLLAKGSSPCARHYAG